MSPPLSSVDHLDRSWRNRRLQCASQFSWPVIMGCVIHIRAPVPLPGDLVEAARMLRAVLEACRLRRRGSGRPPGGPMVRYWHLDALARADRWKAEILGSSGAVEGRFMIG